jgi:uncharacterized protein
MLELLKQPWSWYVAGTIIGLTVPFLLILGNKHFGISANLRHVCAACLPGQIKLFKYDWRKEVWNLFFVAGVVIGGFIAATLLPSSAPLRVNSQLVSELKNYGINHVHQLLPPELFSFEHLFSLRGLITLIGGGFLVGFGARYAGGCTSGHTIMGISNLQIPSVIATVSFMAGGFVMANLILPLILKL